MRREILLGTALAFGALIGLGAAVATAAPVTVANQGFENPAIVGSTHIFDSTMLAGWQIPTGNIDMVTAEYWQPHSGNQSIDLYGCAAGTIRQQIATTAGHNYNLSYWIAGNTDSVGLRSSIVSVGTAAGLTDLATKPETFDTTGKTHTNMGWVQRSLAFTATSATTWIQFNDTSSTTCQGVALDDVAVEDTTPSPDVPETPYAVMLPLAALAVGGAAYAFRRRATTRPG